MATRVPGPAPAPVPAVVTTALLLPQFVLTVESSVITLALPTIQADLRLSPSQGEWLITSYLLALGGLLIIAGRAADRFDARRVLALGWSTLGAASVLGALAPGFWSMLAARVGLGVGAAAIAPVAVALITQLYPAGPPRQRVLSLWAGVGSVGFAAGLVGGGWLVADLGWRSIFWINVPLVGLGLLALLRVRSAPPREGSASVQLRFLPSLGWCALPALTLVTAAALAPGGSWRFAVVTALAAAAVAVALFRAERGSAVAVVPLGLLAVGGVLMALVVTVVFGVAATNGLFVALSLDLQTLRGMSASAAGAALLPLCAASAVSSLVISRLAGRVRLGVICAVACALVSGGLSWLALGGAGYGSAVLPALVLIGAGYPGVLLFPIDLASRTAPGAHKGLIAGLLNCRRRVKTDPQASGEC